MLTPDDPILYGFSFRELTLHMAVPALLLGLFAYRRIKRKYWDWLSLTLALILLAVWPFLMTLHWFIEGRLWR